MSDPHHEKHLPDAQLLHAIKGYELALPILRKGQDFGDQIAAMHERLNELRIEAKRRGLLEDDTEPPHDR